MIPKRAKYTVLLFICLNPRRLLVTYHTLANLTAVTVV